MLVAQRSEPQTAAGMWFPGGKVEPGRAASRRYRELKGGTKRAGVCAVCPARTCGLWFRASVHDARVLRGDFSRPIL